MGVPDALRGDQGAEDCHGYRYRRISLERGVRSFDEFKREGWEVVFFTVSGEPPKPDPLSLKFTGPQQAGTKTDEPVRQTAVLGK
jgi:hypothetical protein